MKICYACKKELTLSKKISRREECPFCHADLHCCLNCQFYDSSASQGCREPVAEQVKDKLKANFCDFFSFADAPAAADQKADQARVELDNLFRRS